MTKGDIVKVIFNDQTPPSGPLLGMVGVVRGFRGDGGQVGVEFDRPISGHNLDGAISSTRGWWVRKAHLVKLEIVTCEKLMSGI